MNVKENRSYVRVADHQSDLHSHITTPLRKYVNVKENRSYVRVVDHQNKPKQRCSIRER